MIELKNTEENTATKYDHLGRVSKTTNLYTGLSVTTTYDDFGNVIKTKDSKGKTETTEYDKYQREISKTDAYGRTSTTEYDVYGNINVEIDATQQKTTKLYNKYGDLLSTTNNLGLETATTYNDLHQKVSEVVDEKEVTYLYDANGQLIETQDNNKGKSTTEYDPNGNVISTTDVLGNKNITQYNKNNLAIKETDARGNSSISEYNAFGDVIKTTDALGNTTQTVYNDCGQKEKEIDERGFYVEYIYDEEGRLVELVDKLGYSSYVAYNGANQVSKETDPNGNEKTYKYDKYGQVIEESNGRGFITKTKYDVLGNTIKVTKGDLETTNTYDELGRLTETKQVVKQYDGSGHVSEESTKPTETAKPTGPMYQGPTRPQKPTTAKLDTVPEDRITTNEYNDKNQVIKTTDANGNESTFEYDKFGNQVITNDRGFLTESKYNVYGELLSQSENSNYKQVNEYDALSRLVKTTTNGNVSLEKAYDENGNEVRTVEYNKPKEIVYDALNRPIELKIAAPSPFPKTTTRPTTTKDKLETEKAELGEKGKPQPIEMIAVQKVTYDASGNAVEIEDGNSNKEVRTFDANNNETSITNARGVKQTYAYDGLNNLVKAENPYGRVVSYVYDANNNMITKDLNGKYALYSYDKQDNLTKEQNEYEYVTKYQNDVYGNKIEETKPDGTLISREYDNNNNLIKENKDTFTYNQRDKVVKATNTSGTVTYKYNAFDNITKVKDTEGKTIKYTYNKDKHISTIQYDNGDTVSYTYNEYDLLSKVKKNKETIASYTYNPRGEVIELQQGDTTTTYGYDNIGNPIEQDTKQGKKTIRTSSMKYDENNNLVKEVINHQANTYKYNDADELIESKKWIEGKQETTTYTYDMYGNKSVSNSKEGVKTYKYNDKNQVEEVKTDKGTISYHYNENGNLENKILEDGSKELYTYNDKDELTELVQGQYVYNYSYDAEGERIKEVREDTYDYPMTVWYDYNVADSYGISLDEGKEEQKFKESFDMLREQVAKKEANGGVCGYITTHTETDSYPDTYNKADETTTFTLDRNQEYTQIIEENGKSNIYGLSLLEEDDTTKIAGLNGSIVAEGDGKKYTLIEYQDYGKSNQQKEDTHGYNGEYQEATGLIYLRARYYDPEIGSFIQIDNNYSGEKEDTATQNRYNYTLSNPYKYVDRSGDISIADFAKKWAHLTQEAFAKKLAKQKWGWMENIAAMETWAFFHGIYLERQKQQNQKPKPDPQPSNDICNNGDVPGPYEDTEESYLNSLNNDLERALCLPEYNKKHERGEYISERTFSSEDVLTFIVANAGLGSGMGLFQLTSTVWTDMHIEFYENVVLFSDVEIGFSLKRADTSPFENPISPYMDVISFDGKSLSFTPSKKEYMYDAIRTISHFAAHAKIDSQFSYPCSRRLGGVIAYEDNFGDGIHAKKAHRFSFIYDVDSLSA